jgi:hypothetical protein
MHGDKDIYQVEESCSSVGAGAPSIAPHSSTPASAKTARPGNAGSSQQIAKTAKAQIGAHEQQWSTSAGKSPCGQSHCREDISATPA